jgi:hypothetical protein
MVAAAGQQWYAGRQQEHEAGAQIPVARGIGSVLVANCALKNEKSGAARADSTQPSGADCGVFSLTGLSCNVNVYSYDGISRPWLYAYKSMLQPAVT